MTKFKQYISEDNLNDDQEYIEFINFINSLNEDILNEGMFSNITGKLKDKLSFITDLSKQLGTKISDIIDIFKNKRVFKFFVKIGWSLTKLYDLLKVGLKSAHILADAISEYIAQTKVVKWTTEKLTELDEWLQKHPKIRKMAGLAVAALLIYIWFNMTFTGDVSYDFGMDDVIAALSGSFSLSTILGGKSGIKLLALFTTGMLGLSFPWPGASTVQFAGAIIATLAKKLNIRTRFKFKLKR